MAAALALFSALIATLSPAGAQADPGSKPESPAILARPAKVEIEVKDAPIDADTHRLEVEAGTTANEAGATGATVAVRGDKKLVLTGDNSFRTTPGIVLNAGGEARVDVLIDQNGSDADLGRLRLRLPGISVLTGQDPDMRQVRTRGMDPSFAGEFALLRVGGIYDDDKVAGARTAGVDAALFTGGVQKSFSVAGLPMDVCLIAEPLRIVAGANSAAGETTDVSYRGSADACLGARLGEVIEIRDNVGIEANVGFGGVDTDGDPDTEGNLPFKGFEVRNRLAVNTRFSKDVTMSTAWTYERSYAQSAWETTTTTNRHLFTVGVGF